MYKIAITISIHGQGFFALKQKNRIVGRIKISLVNNYLILLDTIVLVKRYLHLIGARILLEIVEYARMHELKIITISKFTQRQFSSNPALYTDVWEKADSY